MNDLDKRIKKATTVLDLSGLGLTEIPKSVYDLTDLKELYLHTKPRVLFILSLKGRSPKTPDNIKTHTLVDYMLLGASDLKNLPKEIRDLKKLEFIYLNKTQLKTMFRYFYDYYNCGFISKKNYGSDCAVLSGWLGI